MQHKQTATGLAALGRGPDTELIHMTKGEIAGLQSLAQQHGGSLTINPHTGLPEAGFLSSIMPMVIGAGLVAATGGTALALSPMMAAGIVGGGYTLATGSLQKGLMAGLGAYGGAGLASSLGAAGAGAAGAGAAGAGAAGAAPTIAADTTMAAVQGVGTSAASTSAQQAATQALGGNVGMYPMTSAAAPSFAAGQTAAASPFAGIGTITQTPVIAAPSFAAGPTTAASPFAAQAPAAASGSFMSRLSDVPGKYLGAAGIAALSGMDQKEFNAPEVNQGMIRPYTFNRTQNTPTDALGSLYTPGQSTRERNWFEDSYTAGTPYKAPGPEYMAAGGPVEAMSNANALGQNTGYPMSDIQSGAYSTALQRPISQNVVTGAQDAAVDPYTGQATFADGGEVSGGIISSLLAQQKEERPQYENGSVGGYNYDQATGAFSRSPEIQRPQMAPMPQDMLQSMYQNEGGMGGFLGQQMAQLKAQQDQRPRYANNSVGGYNYNQGTGQFTQLPAMAAGGGISTLGGNSNLGGYSDGGQLLRGPGDGVSDSIPARIGAKQEARLADGEFVIPARIVSELGNGSTEAGSRQLYAMMDRVQKARKKSIGKGKVATNTRANKLLPV